jgi:hypothetical protein
MPISWSTNKVFIFVVVIVSIPAYGARPHQIAVHDGSSPFSVVVGSWWEVSMDFLDVRLLRIVQGITRDDGATSSGYWPRWWVCGFGIGGGNWCTAGRIRAVVVVRMALVVLGSHLMEIYRIRMRPRVSMMMMILMMMKRAFSNDDRMRRGVNWTERAWERVATTGQVMLADDEADQ